MGHGELSTADPRRISCLGEKIPFPGDVDLAALLLPCVRHIGREEDAAAGGESRPLARVAGDTE